MTQMPLAAAASAIAATSASSINAPVGLPGELRMIAFVRGEIAAITASACTLKPSLDCVETITGTAPISLTCSGMVGQYGACVMTSSPGSNSASAALNSACLPPTVINTSEVVMSTP